LKPLAMGRTHHLYCSRFNKGALAVAQELRTYVRESSPSKKQRAEVLVTSSRRSLDSCEHMLLYLTSQTWTSGSESAALAHEVCQAQRAGVHLLLAHEFPSNLGDNEVRHACAFDNFWNDGWTPRHLLKGEANVYKQIAMALKGGLWRPAGLAKLAEALAKGGGAREQWRADPDESEAAVPQASDGDVEDEVEDEGLGLDSAGIAVGISVQPKKRSRLSRLIRARRGETATKAEQPSNVEKGASSGSSAASAPTPPAPHAIGSPPPRRTGSGRVAIRKQTPAPVAPTLQRACIASGLEAVDQRPASGV